MKAKNTIQKAKVKDGQLEATYSEYFAEENYSNTIDKKCAQIIHGDLRRAFDKLKVHLVCISEMPEADRFDSVNVYEFDPDDLPNYVVTGYVHGGSGESAGVTIIGKKLLKSGQALNINTPFTQFIDEDKYPYAGALASDIEACDYEVNEYLFHEKFGMKQMSLDFDVPDNVDVTVITEEGEAIPLKKAKGRKKKSIAAEAFDPTA